jgi:hypothetical protein
MPRSGASAVAAAVVYGMLVFAGAALLGFVIAPLAGSASGVFPIDAEARGFFSLLTLKGAPLLAAASVASGFAYASIAARRLSVRAALLALNAAVVWLAGAAIAFVLLG